MKSSFAWRKGAIVVALMGSLAMVGCGGAGVGELPKEDPTKSTTKESNKVDSKKMQEMMGGYNGKNAPGLGGPAMPKGS